VFRKLDEVKDMVRHENKVSLMVEHGERRIPTFMSFAQKHGIGIQSVELHKPSLEDVFLKFTGATLRDRESGESESPKSAHPMAKRR
jgi:ABC-2 type transport system ATP-binding protein